MTRTTRVCCALVALTALAAVATARDKEDSPPVTHPAAGKPIASNLDYDLPFIPVVMVISPICIGMCVLLSWFAPWVSRREQRSPRTEAVDVAPAEPGTLLRGGAPPAAPGP
jgi:hypothetical protein